MFSYFGFWASFYHGGQSLRSFLESLLAYAKMPVEIHSVFPNNKKQHIIRGGEHTVVQFSGEPNYDDPNKFDLNLIMEPTDLSKRIVWCPLFSVGSYENNYWPLYWSPRPIMPKTRFCAFVVSNPRAHVRNKFFHKLSQYKHIDSCGSAMNNCGFCAPREGYLDFLQQFKFMICFENTSSSHYITEKLHNAYLGGTIPIYWGCTKANQWLNGKAFLQLEDDSDEAMDHLVQRIIELDQDYAKYMAMHKELLLPSRNIPHEMKYETMQQHVNKVVMPK